jgi:hypothetical protein
MSGRSLAPSSRRALLGDLEQLTYTRLPETGPGCVSSTLQRFFSLCHNNLAVLDKLLKHAAGLGSETFVGGDLVAILSGMVTMGHQDADFLSSVTASTRGQLRHFNALTISNIALILSKLRHYDGHYNTMG